MKNRIFFLLISLSATFMLWRCNLEKIEPDIQGTGRDETKFLTTIGGNSIDFPSDIILSSDGGYIVVGSTQSFSGGDDKQVYIAKLDANGTLIWERNFGDDKKDDFAHSAITTSDGGYIFCGSTESFNPDFIKFVYVGKINSQGTPVWEKGFGDNKNDQRAFGIVSVGNNEYFIGYQHQSDNTNVIKMMHINSDGNKVGEEDKTVYTGNVNINRMIKTSDDKILITGILNGFPSGSASFVAKLDEKGNLIWEKTFPEQNFEFTLARGIVEVSNKNVIVVGSDLGVNDHDFLLLKYSEIGAKIDEITWGGANADEILGITTSLDGEIVVVGYTRSYSNKSEIYLGKLRSTDGLQFGKKISKKAG